jgi:hypothetical protein
VRKGEKGGEKRKTGGAGQYGTNHGRHALLTKVNDLFYCSDSSAQSSFPETSTQRQGGGGNDRDGEWWRVMETVTNRWSG